MKWPSCNQSTGLLWATCNKPWYFLHEKIIWNGRKKLVRNWTVDWRVFDVGECCLRLNFVWDEFCSSATSPHSRPKRSSPPPSAHRRTLELVEMRNGAEHKLCQELHTSTQSKTYSKSVDSSTKHQTGAESAPTAEMKGGIGGNRLMQRLSAEGYRIFSLMKDNHIFKHGIICKYLGLVIRWLNSSQS